MMKNEKENVSQVDDQQEPKVEDLSVDEEQQNQVKGGAYKGGVSVGLGDLN